LVTGFASERKKYGAQHPIALRAIGVKQRSLIQRVSPGCCLNPKEVILPKQMLYPLAAVGLALAAILVFSPGESQAAPVQLPVEHTDAVPHQAANPLAASRAISIPYGIESTLALNLEGASVSVVGHADCPDGGGRLRIRTLVIQNWSGAIATGSTADTCAGERQSWRAEAATWGQFGFEAGNAEACAVAVVHDQEEDGAIAYQWCKEVTLE
jgi:hypothetical protein